MTIVCIQSRGIILLLFTILLLAALPVAAQKATEQRGSVVRVKVHGYGLEENLAGDSPDRDVSIYLPPSYKTNPNRRYPVVYFLHGYTDNDAKFYGFSPHWMNLPEVLDQGFLTEKQPEMIFVTPNAYTRFQGSMYSNSATTGNWEQFIAEELVSYIDKNYRTLPTSASRGLAGHSMGGYGAMRIGMKYPTVFSSIYLLSPCCLDDPSKGKVDSAMIDRLQAVKSQEDLDQADFFTKILFASAAAWSPNPQNPPFFLDLPVANGEVQPQILAKWTANRPLTVMDQYIYNIRKLKGLAFDAGNEDKGIAASIKELDKVLDRYSIVHQYEEYPGDHLNKVAERIGSHVLLFFSENLSFEPTSKDTK